ncbi:MAG: iron-sulfur cluster assembly accessory protein [Alphaproteobacteria bacterium]|nr:MAG: iron-sulfur cluster assembly accessory protein [Alphaproteobacteria bacterium]
MTENSITPTITITDAAAARIRDLLARRGRPSAGIRLGTRTQGCSGLSYAVDYVDEPRPDDQVIEDKGVRLYIDRASLAYIAGSEMDYVEDKFTSGFTFNNPNETGRCGCGESFTV